MNDNPKDFLIELCIGILGTQYLFLDFVILTL